MKIKYDGMSTTFTPEGLADQELLIGFANLDEIIDHCDTPSLERLMQLTRDCSSSMGIGFRALKDSVLGDSANYVGICETPPEDEDEDDAPIAITEDLK